MKGTKIVIIILTLCLVAALLPLMAVPAAAGWSGEGNGTSANPYRIGTAAELVEFCNLVKGGYGNENAVLTADIDLGGAAWTPIGIDYAYDSTFDGQGHTISGLNVCGDFEHAGLFARVALYGAVKNLSVSGTVTVMTDRVTADAGGIVGMLSASTVENCRSTVTITITNSYGEKGVSFAGGVVGDGESYSKITNCYSTGAVTVSGTTRNSAGGIMGYGNKTNTTNCYATGAVTTPGGIINHAGGVIGQSSQETVTGCYCLSGNVIAVDNGTTTNCAVLTADQMKNSESFNGFDFTNTWYMGTSAPLLKCFMPAAQSLGTGVLRTGVNTKDAQIVRFGLYDWYVVAYDAKNENGQVIRYEQETTNNMVNLYQAGTATLLLGALLSDTCNFKSGTTTSADKEAVKTLRTLSGISDTDAFYREMYKASISYDGMTDKDVFYSDYKEYESNGTHFCIGCVNAYDEDAAKALCTRMKEAMPKLKDENGSDLMFAQISIFHDDISITYIVPCEDEGASIIEEAFGERAVPDGTFYRFEPGMSRKQVLVPAIMGVLAADYSAE